MHERFRDADLLLPSLSNCLKPLVERSDQRAADIVLLGAAFLDELVEHTFNLLKTSDLVSHIAQLAPTQRFGFVAMGAVFEFQQFSDFLQTESQPSCPADESKPCQRDFVVRRIPRKGFSGSVISPSRW